MSSSNRSNARPQTRCTHEEELENKKTLVIEKSFANDLVNYKQAINL